jgi:hypothetical protein
VRPRIATARTPLAAGLPAGGGRGLSVGEARRSQLAAGRVPRDDGAGLGALGVGGGQGGCGGGRRRCCAGEGDGGSGKI